MGWPVSMSLPTDDQPLAWVNWLARMHDADLPQLREYNDLYEGTAPLYYLHPDVLREVEDRIQTVSLGWPMLAVDPLEERLDHLAFRYPEDDQDPDAAPEEMASFAGDRNLQRVWQDNNLDEESQLGHLDALVMKRAYVCVGANEEDGDTPLVSVESPLEMFGYVDPRTRSVRAVLRRWIEHHDSLVALPATYATLYLPNATYWYDRGPQGWRETGRDEHRLGQVPVTPLVNRARLSNRYGRSELTPPLMSLSHAANKIATDMMVAAEFHAIPLRAVFGLGPDDFKDAAGNRMSALQVIMGRLLTAVGDETGNIKPHEFSASSLANFHDTLTQLAKHATALVGLPPTAFGVVTDTPASAEAWRAAEARLIKRAERRQVAFSGSWERTARLIRRFQDGDWDPQAKRLESIWRDASTPTRAQAADAAVKLVTANVITARQGQEDLGYSPGAIRRMAAERKAERDEDPVQAIARGLSDRVPAAPPGPVEVVPAGAG